METETAPLLRARPTSRRRSWLVGSIALSSSLLFLRGMRGEQTRARGATVGSALAASGQASMDDDGKAQTWEIYKHATPVMNGQGRGIFDFVTQYLCPSMGPPTNLGCGGLKVGCTVKCASCTTGSAQLHWVDSRALDEHSGPMGVEGWERYFEEQNGNLTHFNAFMHNKNQLCARARARTLRSRASAHVFLRAPPSPPARSRSYVDDLSTFQHALDEGGVPYFRRTSFFADDADDGDATEAAHLGVQVAGRLVELVGPFDSLADADGFVPWKEHECPTAHALRFRASEYSEWASAVELYDDEVVAWGARDFGRETPLFAAAHATASDPEERAALFGALGNLTDAAVSVLESSAACTVVSITWPGQIDGFEMRYVDNRLAVHGTLSPRDYDTYVDRVHETYLAETDTEFNWDHWLDQHLGLRYNAAEYDVCAPMDDTVRHRLRGDAVGDGATGTPTVPLAKRRSLEYIDTGELNCETPPRAPPPPRRPSRARALLRSRALAVAVGRRVDVLRDPPPAPLFAWRAQTRRTTTPRSTACSRGSSTCSAPRTRTRPTCARASPTTTTRPSPASRATTSSASRRARRTRPCCTARARTRRRPRSAAAARTRDTRSSTTTPPRPRTPPRKWRPRWPCCRPSRGTRHAPHRAAIPGSACATRVATRRAATRSATGRLTPSRARR